MQTQLFELNSLEKRQSIWVKANVNSSFEYSDGNDEQMYLLELFKSSNDLSTGSKELAQAIQDWPSEYHLSQSRGNLLKGINLPAKSKILEVGCGCGAITRFLGEQNYDVHALEGSFQRAQITRERTRDLKNIEVINHNFNTLKLPEDHYDVILFIGVLEYAKKFKDNADSLTSEEVVAMILNKANDALKNSGCIIVAIENRTGLKYEKGAFEDHLALPYIGMENYSGYEHCGIKTFDCFEWGQIISGCGFSCQYFFPFPDYKLPNLIINNVDQPADFPILASEIHSFDPISTWTMPGSEFNEWIEVFGGNHLREKSNSFGIVIAKSKQYLERRFKYDWRLYDSNDYSPKVDVTSSKNLKSISAIQVNRKFNSELVEYPLLIDSWHCKLYHSPQMETLFQLCHDLYKILDRTNTSNIIIDHDQISIDEEKLRVSYLKHWSLESHVSAEFQLFHMLLGFFLSSRKYLAACENCNLLSVETIISQCFGQIGLNYKLLRTNLIKAETDFRISAYFIEKPIEDDLNQLITNYNQFDFKYINSQVFWAKEIDQFNACDSLAIRHKQVQTLTRSVFKSLTTEHKYIRFDPCDHEHGYNHCLQLNSIFITNDSGEFVANLDFSQIVKINQIDRIVQSKQIYKICGSDPQIIFKIPNGAFKNLHHYNLNIHWQWLGN